MGQHLRRKQDVLKAFALINLTQNFTFFHSLWQKKIFNHEKTLYPAKIDSKGFYLKRILKYAEYIFSKLYQIPLPNSINYFGTNKNNFVNYFIKPARSSGFSQIKKIPYQAPPNSIGALKMYILEKRILGTQILMLRF